MKVLNLEGLRYLVEKIKGSTVECARKLSNTSAIGSATKPIYFNSSGVPVAGKYTLGAACAKGVSTSVTSGDMNLVTGDAVSSAISTATNYEEGTFTPVFYNGSTKVKTGAVEAAYKKIGNLVYIFISNMWNGSFPKITSIKGLPFSAVVSNNIGRNVLNECQLYSNVSGNDSDEYIDSYISGTEMTVSLSEKSSVNVSVLSVCGIYKIS